MEGCISIVVLLMSYDDLIFYHTKSLHIYIHAYVEMWISRSQLRIAASGAATMVARFRLGYRLIPTVKQCLAVRNNSIRYAVINTSTLQFAGVL